MADETMIDKVKAYMAFHNMTEAGDRLLVGFSGGADSLCLLELLREMAPSAGFSVAAMHVNHGIRGTEADRDEAFAEAFCRERGIPFYTVHVDVPDYAAKAKLSLEEAGRRLRYDAFEKAMAEHHLTKLALAHHENDLAETMLYNMARGTGLAGLCSLKPKRGSYIRPLLCVSREVIEAEVKRRGLTYVTDSTNLDDEPVRNRLRHTVIPCLTEKVNAGTLRHMRELSEMTDEVLDFVASEAETLLNACGHEVEGGVLIENRFFDAPAAVVAEGLRLVIDRTTGTRRDMTRRHIEMLKDLGRGEIGRQGHLPEGVLAEKTAEGLVIKKRRSSDMMAAGVRVSRLESVSLDPTCRERDTAVFGKWRFSAEILDFVPISIPENAYTKWLDYDRMNGTLRVRTRRAGDRLTVTGEGGHKSVSDYLTNLKLPKAERDELPLICDDDEVIWIVGYRIGAIYKVTSQTKRVLKITAELDV